MTFYADSVYPVRDDLAAIHEKQLNELGEAGTWGAGAQRLAIAQEARQAGYDAGVLEPPAEADPKVDVTLAEVAQRVVRRLAVSPKDVDEAFYDQAIADGLSDEEYTEIVGIVSRVTDIDIFTRGIGVPLRPLPSAKPGQPSRERPESAIKEQAWVPTVPNPPEGGDFANALYDGHPKPYIVRALSLVPDELRAHLALEEIQYLPLHRILEADYQHHEGLTRAQAETVAGRVSAINECFY
jgi:hypothetical protein